MTDRGEVRFLVMYIPLKERFKDIIAYLFCQSLTSENISIPQFNPHGSSVWTKGHQFMSMLMILMCPTCFYCFQPLVFFRDLKYVLFIYSSKNFVIKTCWKLLSTAHSSPSLANIQTWNITCYPKTIWRFRHLKLLVFTVLKGSKISIYLKLETLLEINIFNL